MEPTKLESKYERLRKIGIGSYGVVFKCINRQTGQVVAIKRYTENDSDPIIRKIAMREVRMLRQLKHPNLINLIEVFRRKKRLHLVFDYCELTVLDVIEKYACNCPTNLIKKITWQLVNGVNYCHSNNCIHRDIKPENILINQSGVVKLCDFGFARHYSLTPPPAASAQTAAASYSANFVNGHYYYGSPQARDSQSIYGHDSSSPSNQQRFGAKRRDESDKENTARVLNPNYDQSNENTFAKRPPMTEYVATRWYRAPELLVGDVYYDTKIDIWAVGCVTAELMRGEPIWPGKTDLDQLQMIKSSLGELTEGQTRSLLTQNLYDQSSVDMLLVPAPAGAAAESVDRKLQSTNAGTSGVDFVSVCLQMDPNQRPTSEQLLLHDYIHSSRMLQFLQTNDGGTHSPQYAHGQQQVAFENSAKLTQGQQLAASATSRFSIQTSSSSTNTMTLDSHTVATYGITSGLSSNHRRKDSREKTQRYTSNSQALIKVAKATATPGATLKPTQFATHPTPQRTQRMSLVPTAANKAPPKRLGHSEHSSATSAAGQPDHTQHKRKRLQVKEEQAKNNIERSKISRSKLPVALSNTTTKNSRNSTNVGYSQLASSTNTLNREPLVRRSQESVNDQRKPEHTTIRATEKRRQISQSNGDLQRNQLSDRVGLDIRRQVTSRRQK